MKKILLGVALAATMGAASASTFSEAVSSLNGQEVSINGSIGYSWTSEKDVEFKMNGSTYDVVLDAGRSVRKGIANCKFTLFGNATKPCAAAGMAEVKVKGEKISLVVYELELLNK